MKRTAKAFVGDARGATAVEFGLIAVPFIGILMATLDMGIGFYVERNLDAAVQDAARQIRTGTTQAAGIVTASKFLTTYVCPTSGGLLGTLIDCTKLIVDVRTASALTGNDMSGAFYKTPTQNTFCLGSPGTVTIVRVAYPMPWYLPVITASGTATNGLVNDVPGNAGSKLLLVAASAVKTEPYPAANYQTYKAAKGC